MKPQAGRCSKVFCLLSAALFLGVHGVFAQPFVHPGCLSTASDFARMRAKVRAGAHPWIDSWSILTNNASAQTNYAPHPQPVIYRGGSYPQTYTYAMRDAAAAYQLGLRWQITGDSAYANTATNILNQWADTCTNVSGDSNYALAAGLYGYEFACAAENLRGYSGWNAADFAKFQAFMTNVFYSANNYFLTYHNGTCDTHYWANWDLCNMDSMLAIGVLCDRRDIYDQAISYYTNGVGAGAASRVMTFSHPGFLGQCQESGRDQGHCTLDPVLLGVFCEIAWNQGDDMYGYDTNELLQLAEYVCKYNVQPLDNTVPFVCYNNCEYYSTSFEDGGITPYVSPGSRGTIRPGWSLIYNHYVNRRGLAAPWTGLMVNEVNPEGGGGNYGSTSGGYDGLGFTTLTHTLDPISPQSVPAPGDLMAQPRNNTVTLSWFGSAGATSYTIKRASTLAGPYATIASVSPPSDLYVDVGLTQGATYYYAVSAMVNGVETTNSEPASATPNLQLSGAIIGSGGSYQNAGATITNLFDGSLEDFYDAADATGDWGGMDFGVSNVITQVAYCPRPGFSGRMVGGQFQGCNVPDFSSGVVTLFTISNAPADTTPPALTYQQISQPNAFRYVRYIGPVNGWGNAAEVQFFGAPPAPVPPAAPLNLQAAAGDREIVLSWSESDTATSYNVKRASVSGGPYSVVATNVATTTFTDTGLSNDTNYFYVVSAVNGAGEGGDSVEVAAVPSTGLRAGSLVWSGGTNGVWDTTTANWMTNFVPAIFQNGSAVLFDDTAPWANVSLPAPVSPSVMTFNNYTKGYTLSGSAISGAATIQIIGGGSVALNNANTFTGGVTVDVGTVIVDNADAFGTGPITLAGGTIQWGGTGYTITNAIVALTGTSSTLAEAGSASAVFSGNLTGGGAIYANSSVNYGGTELSGDNHGFSGTLTVNNSSSQRFRFLSATAGSSNAVWVLNNNTGDGQSANLGNGTLYLGALAGDGQFRQDASGTTTLEIGALNLDTTFSGIIYQANGGDVFSVNKVGIGTLFLSGACNYSGATTVKNGELMISSAFASKGSCTVANGATLGVTNSSSGSGTVSSLTLAGGGTLTLMNVTSGTTPLLSVSGNVAVNGSCTVKIFQPGGIVVGAYPLVDYSGAFQGSFANLQLQLPSGMGGTLVSNANQIVLSVTSLPSPTAPATLSASAGNAQVALNWNAPLYASGYQVWRSLVSGGGYSLIGSTAAMSYTDATAANNQTYYYVVTATNSFGSSGYSPEASASPRFVVVWTGATNADWDAATTNWSSGGAPATYQDGAIAWFDDTALSNFTINVSTTVSPAMMVVSNYVDSYSISGGPVAGMGSLNKWGSSPLYMSGANTYSGGTTDSFGCLILSASTTGNAGSVASGPLGSGPVVLNGGNLSQDGSSRTLANTIVAVANTTSVLGSVYAGQGANLYLAGALSGGGTLENDPASQPHVYSVFFQGDLSGFTGTLNYTGGNGAYWRVGTSGSTVDLSHAVVVLDGGNSRNFGFTDNSSGIVLNAGSLAGNGYFQGSYFGSGSGTSDTLVVGLLNADSAFSGQLGVSGNNMANFNLVKVGAGTQWLTGPNVYTGQTTVSNGELVISTLFAGNGKCWVTNGATLGVTNVSGASALMNQLTVAAGTTLEFQSVSNTAAPLISAGSVTVGGDCTVKITGTNGLVAGDSYPLIYYSGVFNGSLGSLQLEMPYGWRGILENNGNQIVLANVAVVSTKSPPVSATTSGRQLKLLWPQVNTGWRLQMNTNLTGTNWLDVSGASVTNLILISPANGNAFYRLVYP